MSNILTTLRFLNTDLEISVEDRHEPVLLLYLSQIEFIEEKFGQGLEYFNKLKNNYKVIADEHLANQIVNILTLRHKNENNG
jgi:hypothetical protein